MKKQVALLIELQKMDLMIGRINLKKKELPEKISKLDEEFNNFLADMETEKNKVDDLQKQHKEKEEKLKRGVENLKKTKDRLFDVKTNKEYQAILKEIEVIESKNSEIEDEIIVALDELDRAKAQLKTKESEHKTVRAEYEQSKKKLEDELQLLDEELVTCQQNGSDYAKQIDNPLLQRYETIKGRRNGLAVVSVWKEICDGCHMNIPPQMYNELLTSEDIMQCPFCSRIIYWDDKSKNE